MTSVLDRPPEIPSHIGTLPLLGTESGAPLPQPVILLGSGPRGTRPVGGPRPPARPVMNGVPSCPVQSEEIGIERIRKVNSPGRP